MKMETLFKKFAEQIAADPALQEKIPGLDEAGFADLLAENGITGMPPELAKEALGWLKSQIGAANGELSDEDLDNVNGGFGFFWPAFFRLPWFQSAADSEEATVLPYMDADTSTAPYVSDLLMRKPIEKETDYVITL